MNKLSLAFFGAPDFAADVLRQVIEDESLPVEVKFVVTQPDRPAGRNQTLTPTPVKLLAQKYTISVFETLHVTRPIFHDVDLVLLYAYGELIPKNMLKIPHWGFWNIHPSLLPLYRGPSPITYPLLLGDKKTGVSLIQMDERLDSGPIIDQEEYVIQSTDTQEILRKRLSDIGYKLFKKNVLLLAGGALQKKEQDNAKATFTRLLTKKDGFVPFPIVQKIVKGELPVKEEPLPIFSDYYTKNKLPFSVDLKNMIWNYYRALSPWPGLWTLIPGDKRLKITKMELQNGVPKITHVQLEGKKEVDFNTFQTAYIAF